MKPKLENLQARLLSRISAAARAGKLEEVAAFSTHASRVKELFGRLEQLEKDAEMIAHELNEIEGIHENSKRPHSLAPAPAAKNGSVELDELVSAITTKRRDLRILEIKIDWAKNGHPGGVEMIRESFASDSLVKLFESLRAHFSSRAFDVGSTVQVNRGPFVSRNPRADFVNRVNGEAYSSQPVRGTDWFVLTHSTTNEKVRDVRQLLEKIGLKPGTFSVTAVSR
ncbi:MAG: hypothetical protein HZA93_22765 [Verrucomicrobia bacterium]|nr:hypothetical protein [Verrucomicrobiota bacterium]